MKIMFLNARDLAGVTYNFAKAINKYTKHEADQIATTQVSVMKNPAMHYWNNEDKEKLRQLIYDSDAIVFHEWLGIPTNAMKLDIKKLRGKIFAVTFGGAGFRKIRFRQNCMKYYNELFDNVKYMVQSPDFPEEEDWPWVPRCVATDELREKYNYVKHVPPVVATSPHPMSDGVNPAVGNVSDVFKKVTSRLSGRGFKFKANCISNYEGGVDNDTCLKLKAPASIFFDRLYKVFGLNSIEAATFESAVVTGTNQFALDYIKQSTGITCPFTIVNNWKEVSESFEELISDPKYMRQKGLECYKYAEAVHGGKTSAERIIKILES